jgi:DNA-binding transcriptional MerR regulator
VGGLMEQIKELIKQLDPNQNIYLEDIPRIDLYMDQVIQLFETNFKSSKRNENEKILTKTMINNYAKGKLFIPVKNKKYSKDHIMLISLIYQLKGALSIGDIKMTLDGINEKATLEDFDLEQFYKSYLALFEINTENFKEALQEKVDDVQVEISQVDKDAEYLEKVLLIASFVNMSNLYRKAAEKLVDTLK